MVMIQDSIVKVGIPLGGNVFNIFSRWYVVSNPIFLFSATTSSHTQIDLAWTDDCEDEDGYSIEQSSDGISWAEIDTTIADETSYPVTGLTPATKYYFRIRAFKGTVYTVYSNIDNATTDVAP